MHKRQQTNVKTITYDGEKSISVINEEERFLKTCKVKQSLLITVLFLRMFNSIFNEIYL